MHRPALRPSIAVNGELITDGLVLADYLAGHLRRDDAVVLHGGAFLMSASALIAARPAVPPRIAGSRPILHADLDGGNATTFSSAGGGRSSLARCLSCLFSLSSLSGIVYPIVRVSRHVGEIIL